RIGIPAVEFEEPLARLRRGFVGSLESQEVPPNPDEVGPVWRKGGRPRDRRQRLLAFSDRVRQSGPARPCLRILAVRRREPDAYRVVRSRESTASTKAPIRYWPRALSSQRFAEAGSASRATSKALTASS